MISYQLSPRNDVQEKEEEDNPHMCSFKHRLQNPLLPPLLDVSEEETTQRQVIEAKGRQSLSSGLFFFFSFFFLTFHKIPSPIPACNTSFEQCRCQAILLYCSFLALKAGVSLFLLTNFKLQQHQRALTLIGFSITTHYQK